MAGASAADWDPARYLAFAQPRLRPALDLLSHVDATAPGHVVDLGCGGGAMTRLARARWPQARLTGVDSSPAMLAKAAAEGPAEAAWVHDDLAAWADAHPAAAEVVVSNAALHWLDDHDTLLPRLLAAVRPGGVLAVQVPDNFHRPSHQCLFDIADRPRWAGRLGPLLRRRPVLTPEGYHRILAPLCDSVDVWRTDYLHRLEGPDPVFRWTESTILRPLLPALTPDESADLQAAYAEALRAAYPPEPDGGTLFPFRRLFLVARPPGA